MKTIEASGKLPKHKVQQKICYPGYFDCEFDSLHAAVQYFKKTGANLRYHLPSIIEYNICYRDYLREHGVDRLLSRLIQDAPELAEDLQALQSVYRWYEKLGNQLAGYDIQCYNIEDAIIVLGREFQGLADVIAHRSSCGDIGHSSGLYLDSCNPKKETLGIFVSEFYASYPVFDSYDLCDNRSYQNYVFTNKPIDSEKLSQISALHHTINYCMVHEDIPENLLPILYYQGDGNYMILATRKCLPVL